MFDYGCGVRQSGVDRFRFRGDRFRELAFAGEIANHESAIYIVPFAAWRFARRLSLRNENRGKSKTVFAKNRWGVVDHYRDSRRRRAVLGIADERLHNHRGRFSESSGDFEARTGLVYFLRSINVGIAVNRARRVNPHWRTIGEVQFRRRYYGDFKKKGWKQGETSQDGNEHWTRPGKDSGTSATLKDGVFYVFSQNAQPFESNRGYSKFSVFALLEYNGDFSAASMSLKLASSPVEKIEFSPDLLNPGGFLQKLIQLDLERAHKRQPEFALGAAISLLSVICGRKICDELGNRTNIYAVSVGPSGCGKDNARKRIADVFRDSECLDYLGPEDIASESGLINHLSDRPSLLLMLDEMGRFLRTTNDAKGSRQLYEVVTTLIRLYTSSDTVYLGKAYADVKKQKKIDQPCLSIYGTTTPHDFFAALTPDTITGGLVGRLLVFEARESVRQDPSNAVPSTEIIQFVRSWREKRIGGNLSNEFPVPQKVRYSNQSSLAIRDLRLAIDKESTGRYRQELWTRCEQKACKLALLHSVSIGNLDEIGVGSAEWGIGVATHVTRRMCELIDQWVADSPSDARTKAIMRVLRERGHMTMTDLCRQTRAMSKRERQDAIDSLLEMDEVEMVVQKTGRKPVSYITVKKLP